MDEWETFALALVASQDVEDYRIRQERKLRESFRDHMNKVRETQAGGIAHPYIEFSQLVPVSAQKRREAQSLANEKFAHVQRVSDTLSQVRDAYSKLQEFHKTQCHSGVDDCTVHLERLEEDDSKLID